MRTELLADYRAATEGNMMTIRLGQLPGDSRRLVPLIVDVPALPLGEVMKIEVEVTGRDPETGERLGAVAKKTRLKVVTEAESRATERNASVAERIALLWESTMGLGAMRLNEVGDFLAAGELVRDEGDLLSTFATGTRVEASIRRKLSATERRVSSAWDGRSKREAMIAAKKFSKSERDHRSDSKDDWSDHL
jgi:hypothetical protein